MTKLLNKYKEIKRTKKGFTLVELLVVIAILAVLASVSVVGYLGFTTKARNSNAMTELAQVREVLRAELIDGDTNYYKWDESKATEVTKDAYEATSGTTITNGFTLTYSTKSITYAVKGSVSATWSAVLKSAFNDLNSLGGTLYVDGTTTTGAISSITYATTAGGVANWTVSTDELDQGGVNGIYTANKSVNNNTVSTTTTGADTSGNNEDNSSEDNV